MRLAISITGTIVSFGLILVSLLMNFRFGQMLGKTEFDGLVYGLVSACADGFKVILPFTTVWAWRHRRYAASFVSVFLFIIFTSYSIASSLGFSATNRAETKGSRIRLATGYQDLRESYERAVLQRKALSAFRPQAMLQELIKAREQNIRWSMTKGCTDATLPESRVFCDGYFSLRAEWATAGQAENLEAQIADRHKQLQAFSGQTVTGGKADPQLEVLKNLSGFTQNRVEMALTILLTLLVELGSGFGLFVTFGHGGGESDKEERNSKQSHSENKECQNVPSCPSETVIIETWAGQRLIRDLPAQTPLSDLYRDYCHWCRKLDHDEIMTLTRFSRWLTDNNFNKTVKIEGRLCFSGIRLNKRKAEILLQSNSKV